MLGIGCYQMGMATCTEESQAVEQMTSIPMHGSLQAQLAMETIID